MSNYHELKQVLLAVRDESVRAVVRKCLPKDAELVLEQSLEGFRREAAGGRHDLFLADLDFLVRADKAGAGDGMGVIWDANPHADVVILCPPGRIREAVQLVKRGADNYLTCPLDPVEVRHVFEGLQQAKKLRLEINYFRDEMGIGEPGQMVSSRNRAMQEAVGKILLAAPTVSTVLLNGETGVGKGVVAKYLHAMSNRAERPFVSVHCGAIPDTLLESELFGHEKGAFTGAVKRKPGRFEVASGGTVFLDEVGTISMQAQIKLLQVLQDKVFTRVGGDAEIPMTARVVAATNTDLGQLCKRGEFRTDLYFRLNVFPVDIPPLRQRTEDLPVLAEHFLRSLNVQYGKDVRGIHPSVLYAFARYDWPGNVRELENLMERAYILETSGQLTPESFPPDILSRGRNAVNSQLDPVMTLAQFRERAVRDAERLYIKQALAANGGRMNRAAEASGISDRQLRKLMARHGIRKEEFK